MIGYICTGLICLAAAGAVGLLLFRRRDCCGSCKGNCKKCSRRHKL